MIVVGIPKEDISNGFDVVDTSYRKLETVCNYLEVIKIQNNVIAKSPLGKYCLERPVLFVGAKVTCEDIFMEEAIELDDED